MSPTAAAAPSLRREASTEAISDIGTCPWPCCGHRDTLDAVSFANVKACAVGRLWLETLRDFTPCNHLVSSACILLGICRAQPASGTDHCPDGPQSQPAASHIQTTNTQRYRAVGEPGHQPGGRQATSGNRRPAEPETTRKPKDQSMPTEVDHKSSRRCLSVCKCPEHRRVMLISALVWSQV